MRNISTGIDVGSSVTRIVIAEFIKGEKIPRIIGTGQSETIGIKNGYIIKYSSVVESIKNAAIMAEKTSGVKIKHALVSLSGLSLKTKINTGTAIISRSDNEITTLDINKAIADAEDSFKISNRKIIEIFPISFKLDGKEVLGRLEGMTGTKLEAKIALVTYSTQHLEDLLSAIIEAGIEPIDTIIWPLACSIILSEKQKTIGVGLVNIGAEIVSIGIFENGSLVSVDSFPIGSANITSDIAIGFKISLQEAESFKLGNISSDYSRKKLDEIIEARLYDILEIIENHLKKIKRNGLLPAGIVFVGGGANTYDLEKLSKMILKLPSKIGSTISFGVNTKLSDPSWLAVLGLLQYSKVETEKRTPLKNKWKNIKNLIKDSLKQLMP